MLSNRTQVDGSAQFERHQDFAGTINEVLRLGWLGHFSAGSSVLLALNDRHRVSAGERALCRALLALNGAAVENDAAARRLARQAISDSARPFAATPPAELRSLRLARALAVNASTLIGDVVRARRAAQAAFMVNDPDSGWLIGAAVSPPWHGAPPAVQRYARFVAAVHERYRARRAVPLTATELAIFEYLGTGANTVRIAKALDRSPHTVRTHLRNAYGKLGAHGRADALSKVRAPGLLDGSACRRTMPRD